MITPLHLSNTQVSNNMASNIGILPITVKATDTHLAFQGFDLTNNGVGSDGTGDAPSIVRKVTMLLYNRVGSSGEVMSSIVHISTPQAVGDTSTTLGYEPGKTFLNTATATAWNLTKDIKNYSYLNGIRPSKVILPKAERSLFTEAVNTLKTDVMPSHIIGENTITRDGWYTIISLGIVNQHVPAANVEKGLWVYNTVDGKVYIAKRAYVSTTTLTDINDWHPLETWTTDVTLTDAILNNFTYNPWVSKDVIWLSTYDAIYKDAVIDYVKSLDPYSIYPSLKVRARVMDFYIGQNRYADAQYVLQATDFLRTTYKFTGNDNY